MFWKLLTLAILIGFAWWRLQQFLHRRRLRSRGEPVPEARGVRPITLLAGAMLLGYGGYLVWVLARQAFLTFQG
jgi:predicted PurR-regulated permease PerM